MSVVCEIRMPVLLLLLRFLGLTLIFLLLGQEKLALESQYLRIIFFINIGKELIGNGLPGFCRHDGLLLKPAYGHTLAAVLHRQDRGDPAIQLFEDVLHSGSAFNTRELENAPRVQRLAFLIVFLANFFDIILAKLHTRFTHRDF